ncbi:hypothetical protein STVA_41430 [Allostella vacuolata]|nr:hypothetical protein STVA_41430 [Stella vacuolata]
MTVPVSPRHPVQWSARLEAEEVLRQVRTECEALQARLAALSPVEPGSTEDQARAALLAASEAAVAAAEGQVARTVDRVVYSVAVPTRAERARVRREVNAAGCTYPDDTTLRATLRAGVEEGIEPGELQDRLLAAIDAVETALVAGEVIPADAAESYGELHARMRRAFPRYATLLADREYYLDMVPAMIAAAFVRGETRPGRPAETYPRGEDGRVADAILDRIEARGDLQPLGMWIVNRLMQLPADVDRD